MLTADLVRVTRRQGQIYPRYIDPDDEGMLSTAGALAAIFAEAAAAEPAPRRADIDERIADLVEHRADPLLFRGFVKLLFDRSDFEQPSDRDPAALRRTLFETAARLEMRRQPGQTWDDRRGELVARVAAELELTPERLDHLLFADLPANQRITRHKPIDGAALLHRYNLALAQAALLRAVELTVLLPPAEVGAYRQVFRDLKFRQLIHTVRARDDGGYEITVDGPLSLFASANRYGLAMAQFLPVLPLLDEWELRAQLRWGKERRPAELHLDHKRGLSTHRKARGQYITDEQRWFEERFESADDGWSMSRSADILQTERGEVVVPDLRFEHQDGRRAHLEIIGFWRKGSLEARLAQLDDPALDRLILAVSSKLKGEKGKVDQVEHPRIVWFKQILSSKRVRDALDAI